MFYKLLKVEIHLDLIHVKEVVLHFCGWCYLFKKTVEYILLYKTCNIGVQRKPYKLENECYHSILIITGNQEDWTLY